jgi:ribosomal protein S18 acetylase RimI-like enzyme
VGTVRLSVRASNEAAIQLYKRLSYRQVGSWQAYYADGEDALVFEKRLDGQDRL